jgi:hypothetical protein
MYEIIQRLDRIETALARMESALAALLKGEVKMDYTIQQVFDQVQTQTTLVQSVITFITGLQAKVQTSLASTNVAPNDQQNLDNMFATLSANAQALTNAIAANTPNAALVETPTAVTSSAAAVPSASVSSDASAAASTAIADPIVTGATTAGTPTTGS